MTKVKENLYLGTIYEAVNFGEEFDSIVCTMDWMEMGEDNERFPYLCLNKPVIFYCPILRSVGKFDDEGHHEWACKDRLDIIVDFVERQILVLGKKVLIHCAAAQERSPLVVAWILYKLGGYKTFDEAYDYVKSIHPITLDRSTWLR